jgi:hypothetical protein
VPENVGGHDPNIFFFELGVIENSKLLGCQINKHEIATFDIAGGITTR